MIQSFADKRTAAVFAGREVRGWPPELQGLINDQGRICFLWQASVALDVEVVDDH